jgi:hypothetical protein
MMMIRIAEQESQMTWFQMKKIFNKLHLGTLETSQGTVRQTSELSPELKKLFTVLQIDSPNKVLHVET